jgi:hypothetical protein
LAEDRINSNRFKERTMRTISRAEVASRLADGVDLDSPALRRELEAQLDQSALERLERLDRDRDRLLTGRELRRVFREIDRLDRDGSAGTFRGAGPAMVLYGALLAGRPEGAAGQGDAVARAARERAREMGSDYGRDGTPTSPHPKLTGNRQPGESRLAWLAGHWKCNQFVGDALAAAGMAMPTHRMPGGGHHYAAAERLPRCHQHFRKLYAFEDLRPGDVIVVDHPSRGAATAHTEIVVEVGTEPRRLRTVGAHRDGAYERNWSHLLEDATLDSSRGCWEREDDRIYLLRPLRTLRKASSSRP